MGKEGWDVTKPSDSTGRPVPGDVAALEAQIADLKQIVARLQAQLADIREQKDRWQSQADRVSLVASY
jgi:molecular chaperone GrpE (heat shock protein)